MQEVARNRKFIYLLKRTLENLKVVSRYRKRALPLFFIMIL